MVNQVIDRRTVAIPGPRGPRGEKGEQGLPGANAVPTDEAVAAYVADTGSESRAALREFAGRTYLNVLDFGAVGDGVTDDTASVQAALYAAAGNVLVFPAGTYLCGALEVRSHTRVVGNGASVILHNPVGGVVNAFPRAVLTSADQPTYRSPSSTLREPAEFNAAGIVIDGLTLDGASQEVYGLQMVGVDGLSVTGMKITRCAGGVDLRAVKNAWINVACDGILEDGVSLTDQNFAGGASEDITFHECTVTNSCSRNGSGSGMNAFELDDGPRRVRYVRCIARDNAGAGFALHVHTDEFTVADIEYEACQSVNNIIPAQVTGPYGGFHIGQCPADDSISRVTYRSCVSIGSRNAFARAPGAQTGYVSDVFIDGGLWESAPAPAGREYALSTSVYVGKHFRRFAIRGAHITGAEDGTGVYTYADGEDLRLEACTIDTAYTPLYLTHAGAAAVTRVRDLVMTPGAYTSVKSGTCVYVRDGRLVGDFQLDADSGDYSSPVVRLVSSAVEITPHVTNHAGSVTGNAVVLQDTPAGAVSRARITGFENAIYFAGTLGSITSIGNVFTGCTNKYNTVPDGLVEAANAI